MAPNQPQVSRLHGSEVSSQPSQDSSKLLVVIPDRIDIEEEVRLYNELCEDSAHGASDAGVFHDYPFHRGPPSPPPTAPSLFSNDIWLGDSSGESPAFARDVQIYGWSNVGDKLGGAYIVFDCAISIKEGTIIHTLKRYNDFAELHARLRATLPQSQQRFLPTLPPKSPLSKFRPSFLERRRRLLQNWLSSVLLHPDVGGCQIVRDWIMD